MIWYDIKLTEKELTIICNLLYSKKYTDKDVKKLNDKLTAIYYTK
jgi:hypothetical protein